MPMTPAERKKAMPHGGQRRAARRAKVSETFASMVMAGVIEAKTPRGASKLARVRAALAREIGKPVGDVFHEELEAQVA